jgi:proline dehydrogenase
MVAVGSTTKGEIVMTVEQQLAADALRTIARDERLKAHVLDSPPFYRMLSAAAKRYVAGETRDEAVAVARRLSGRGYRISLEYIGENTREREECIRAKEEFVALIGEAGRQGLMADICFDLSHIGLTADAEMAFAHADEMAFLASQSGQYLMVSMEESDKTESIWKLYERLAARHGNVGITVQAHLHRSLADLPRLLKLPGKIRLVKGAFKEPQSIALPRSRELNERYVRMIEACVGAGHPCSIATHDEAIIQIARERGYFALPHVEAEMLYGIRPELAKTTKRWGAATRLYVTYGREWYLYLCHRLAEHPPNLYTALADMADPTRLQRDPYES